MQLEGPIVITGAAGFIGAHLCHYFASQGNSVIAVTRPSGFDWRLSSHPKIKRVAVDLENEGAIKDFLNTYQPPVIFNLSAYGAYSHQMDMDRIYRVNMGSVRTILELVSKQPRFLAFIQAGSSSEYGLNCCAPLETSDTQPDSHYSVSKIGATSLTQYYAHQQGVPAWVLRLYSVYGPLEDPSRLITRLLLSMSKGVLPPLVDPEISRDFIYISDVCQAFESVLEKSSQLKSGEVFNIGSGTKTTIEQTVAQANQVFASHFVPNWNTMKARDWDHSDWYSNPAKAKEVLGWKTKVSLQEGLSKTLEWIKQNPERVKLSLKYRVSL